MVQVRVYARETLLVRKLCDALSAVHCLLVQDPEGLARLVLQRLVAYDIVLAAAAVVNVGHCHWERSPWVVRLQVLLVARFRDH